MGIWAGGVEAGAGDTLKLTLMPVMSNKKGLFMNKTGQLRKTVTFLVCHHFAHFRLPDSAVLLPLGSAVYSRV